MPAFQRLLVIADASRPTSPALQRAAALAYAGDVEVRLCALVREPLIEQSLLVPARVRELARKELLDNALAALDGQVATLRAAGVRAEREAVWAPRPQEALAARVVELGIDLVIKDEAPDAHRASWLHTSTDWPLLRYCPVPMLLATEAAAVCPQRIAASIDALQESVAPSELTERVVRTALDLGQIHGAEVHLASCFPWHAAPTLNQREFAAIRDDALASHAQSLAAVRDRVGIDPARTHALSGLPAVEIPAFVRGQSIDLLVIGAVHRHGLDRLVLGSTAESLLGHLPCDIVLVKPPGFAEALAGQIDLAALRERYRSPAFCLSAPAA